MRCSSDDRRCQRGRSSEAWTDTSETGLESLIVASGHAAIEVGQVAGGTRWRWLQGDPHDYDREYCGRPRPARGLPRGDAAGRSPRRFDLDERQPDAAEVPRPPAGRDHKRGVIDVLRNGIKHGPHHLDLFYGTPRRATRRRPSCSRRTASASPASSATAATRPSSRSTSCLFINGLPVATFELKNSLTKQTVEDAVEQYKRDRDPRELLFQFGRCIVHFAVDDQRGALLHPAQGQGVVVPAVQPGLERRRRQPAEPGRPQDRLPLEADPDAARA